MRRPCARSHLNLARRCIQAGLQSPVGDLQDLMDDTGNLKDVVLNDHRWWVLPETVPAERQVDISLWRNMDQHENQATHEIELLQSIRVTCDDVSKINTKLTIGYQSAEEKSCQVERLVPPDPHQVLHRLP